MNRQGAFAILALVLAIIVGAVAYQAGMAQGLATSGQIVAGGPHYYGHGYGFGFFGILGMIVFLFLVFGLVRAAFGGGPRWGGGHGPWMDRRTMLEEWHQKAHAERTETRDPGTPRAT